MMTAREWILTICSLAVVLLAAAGCSQDSNHPSASSTPATELGTSELPVTAVAEPTDLFDLVEQLAELIDQRLALMPEVAKAKWNLKQPVSVPSREAVLLKELVGQATDVGVSTRLATNFFEAQFAGSKAVQSAMFEEWEAATNRPEFSDARDLDRDLRPEITRQSKAMLSVLRKLEPVLYEAPTIELFEGQLNRLSQQQPELETALKIAFAPLTSGRR